ncbi:MAG: ABC transporter permease [Coriobacteriaceae bacterium]|nr:ABC transporter permease [Coriobacteriaceae bacterium]
MSINLGYFIRESVVNFRRNWVLSLGAVITIYLSLLLVGVSLATSVVVTNIVKSVEEKVSIQIFIKDGANSSDVTSLQNAVAKDDLVKSVRYISKEEALRIFKEQTMKESPEIVEQLEDNPLPASLDVELKDPRNVEQMVVKIKANPDFLKVCDRPDKPEESLKYSEQTVKKLFALTNIVRVVLAAFIGMLAVVSLIFINNAIRLAIYARRKEIGIMRLVGAGNWFIRTPFLLEGVIQSLIGAALAIATLGVVRAALMPRIGEALPFLPMSVNTTASLQISAVLVVSGVLIGLVGAAFALRRYLKV